MERIGSEVERELARGGARDALPLASVTAAWRTAVGDPVARNAWPLRLARDGTLHVATSSATWATELGLLAGEIQGRLRAALGGDAPPRLRFAVGPVPESGPDEVADATRARPTPVPPGVAREAASAAAAIEDPELRELVLRAARASLGRPASDRCF